MKKILLGLALVLGTTTLASATTVYPVSVVSADQNGTVVAPERSDPEAVIGAVDGVFYSLGLGGTLVLDFGVSLVASPGVVTEVTFAAALANGYLESLTVLVSNSLDPASFVEVATVVNSDAQTSASITFTSEPFRYVMLVDTSPSKPGRDGFDVDSIAFSPVPVPAAGLLLGGALLGLGALRRRAKKA